MISFHWAQGFAFIVVFGVGIVIGRIWALPPDQAMNLTSLLVGIVFGLVGIGVTLWASARDRQANFAGLQRDVADVRGDVKALNAAASQMWSPVLQAMLAGAGGTASAPAVLSAVVQERGEDAPTQAAAPTTQSREGGEVQ